MALQAPDGYFFVKNSFNGHVLQKELETNCVVLKPKSTDVGHLGQVWYKDGNFLKCKLTNQALTMNPGMIASGSRLYVSQCQWSPYQKWITKKRFCIANYMEQCKLISLIYCVINEQHCSYLSCVQFQPPKLIKVYIHKDMLPYT